MSETVPVLDSRAPATVAASRRKAAFAIGAVVLILLALIAIGMAVLRGGEPAPSGTSEVAAPAVVTAGDVTVTMTPTGFGPSGAAFDVTFETHSVDLGLDLTSSPTLSVNGSPAGSGTWMGSEPGGHHREGTLTFTGPIASGDTVTLSIDGLPAPVSTSWIAP